MTAPTERAAHRARRLSDSDSNQTPVRRQPTRTSRCARAGKPSWRDERSAVHHAEPGAERRGQWTAQGPDRPRGAVRRQDPQHRRRGQQRDRDGQHSQLRGNHVARRPAPGAYSPRRPANVASRWNGRSIDSRPTASEIAEAEARAAQEHSAWTWPCSGPLRPKPRKPWSRCRSRSW